VTDTTSSQKNKSWRDKLKGLTPENWNCIDCGFNTAPGLKTRAELEQAFAADLLDQGVECRIGEDAEVYMVRDKVWRHGAVGRLPLHRLS